MEKKAISPLLALPPELRLGIYQYVLVQQNDSRIQLREMLPPALLASCRLIRNEASSVFFTENKFVLTINIPPMAYSPNQPFPRVHRVTVPPWIKQVQDISMRNVKIEIDHAYKWVVVTMAEGDPPGGRLKVVEAWLHNGRQKLPLGEMFDRVQAFVDWTIDQSVDDETAGLNYRDIVLIAGKMLRAWAGTIVPA